MNILSEIEKIIGKSQVLDATKSSERSVGIWGGHKSMNVKGIVLPKTTEEVSKILTLCHKMKQTIIPHGGLTNLTFATQAKPDDLILSLEKLNKIEEIDAQSKVVTVQSGVILQNLQEEVAKHNLLYPVDFGARGSAMIGGTIATNAGGIQVLKYGTTRTQVLGLEVVLPDGRILSSLNKMIKDNAGYNLKHLFIGSEGTLGVITKATLRLVSKPTSKNLAFVGADSFEKVIAFKNFIDQNLLGNLTSFEVIWQNYFEFMTVPTGPYKPPIPQDYPFYILFESQGNDVEKDAEIFQNILEKAMENELIVDGTIASSSTEHQLFWDIRENVEILLEKGGIYVFDVCLAIPDMDTYCEGIKRELQEQFGEHELYIFGHFGDGNLHIAIRVKETFGTNRDAVEGIVYKPLQAINGSITAEHGIGLEKKEWLHISRSKAEIETMKQLKNLFDPENILNPGKIF